MVNILTVTKDDGDDRGDNSTLKSVSINSVRLLQRLHGQLLHRLLGRLLARNLIGHD